MLSLSHPNHIGQVYQHYVLAFINVPQCTVNICALPIVTLHLWLYKQTIDIMTWELGFQQQTMEGIGWIIHKRYIV